MTINPKLFTILPIVILATSLTPVASTSRSAQDNRGQEQTQSTKTGAEKPACAEVDDLRKNLQKQTLELQQLRSKVALLEKERLATTIQDQLTKEEQRGELLQLRLIDIAEKDAKLQQQLDQVNAQLRPERIESALAGVGLVHPEEAREEIRKRLTNEKLRLQSQIELLRQDRVRTQSSLATTDASIQRLKIKLAEALRK
jgi:hypothetical protein